MLVVGDTVMIVDLAGMIGEVIETAEADVVASFVSVMVVIEAAVVVVGEVLVAGEEVASVVSLVVVVLANFVIVFVPLVVVADGEVLRTALIVVDSIVSLLEHLLWLSNLL